MSIDYVATLNELPPRHVGLLWEQINEASQTVTFLMRAKGWVLPDDEDVPLLSEVRQHLSGLINEALESYFSTQKMAPATVKPNEIWGMSEDSLFSVKLTGLSSHEGDGYTAQIVLNLLFH